MNDGSIVCLLCLLLTNNDININDIDKWNNILFRNVCGSAYYDVALQAQPIILKMITMIVIFPIQLWCGIHSMILASDDDWLWPIQTLIPQWPLFRRHWCWRWWPLFIGDYCIPNIMMMMILLLWLVIPMSGIVLICIYYRYGSDDDNAMPEYYDDIDPTDDDDPRCGIYSKHDPLRWCWCPSYY